ncbi:unnamed protein product [[Candida] boidinii]|uniref:Unnamed protein product n=1 Tax=Candida boidinii TaxID=5477 RepID=A0ACB5TF50_CANBO|nr:unnamed protein product [[Candida] boidinii]
MNTNKIQNLIEKESLTPPLTKENEDTNTLSGESENTTTATKTTTTSTNLDVQNANAGNKQTAESAEDRTSDHDDEMIIDEPLEEQRQSQHQTPQSINVIKTEIIKSIESKDRKELTRLINETLDTSVENWEHSEGIIESIIEIRKEKEKIKLEEIRSKNLQSAILLIQTAVSAGIKSDLIPTMFPFQENIDKISEYIKTFTSHSVPQLHHQQDRQSTLQVIPPISAPTETQLTSTSPLATTKSLSSYDRKKSVKERVKAFEGQERATTDTEYFKKIPGTLTKQKSTSSLYSLIDETPREQQSPEHNEPVDARDYDYDHEVSRSNTLNSGKSSPLKPKELLLSSAQLESAEKLPSESSKIKVSAEDHNILSKSEIKSEIKSVSKFGPKAFKKELPDPEDSTKRNKAIVSASTAALSASQNAIFKVKIPEKKSFEFHHWVVPEGSTLKKGASVEASPIKRKLSSSSLQATAELSELRKPGLALTGAIKSSVSSPAQKHSPSKSITSSEALTSTPDYRGGHKRTKSDISMSGMDQSYFLRGNDDSFSSQANTSSTAFPPGTTLIPQTPNRQCGGTLDQKLQPSPEFTKSRREGGPQMMPYAYPQHGQPSLSQSQYPSYMPYHRVQTSQEVSRYPDQMISQQQAARSFASPYAQRSGSGTPTPPVAPQFANQQKQQQQHQIISPHLGQQPYGLNQNPQMPRPNLNYQTSPVPSAYSTFQQGHQQLPSATNIVPVVTQTPTQASRVYNPMGSSTPNRQPPMPSPSPSQTGTIYQHRYTTSQDYRGIPPGYRGIDDQRNKGGDMNEQSRKKH